ncbi:ATP-grasp fold amidoligase family protein [Ammoniphilus sp. 3BR4]|uniref:ATP-grasp fold amidoligase family protein n=1 Tax=Ammoniphilus sp. 3BR4 TaxID=3158265 RepID=UPI003467EAD9
MDDEISFIKKRFKRLLGYKPNLENPQTFQEKLQWIKLYGNLERFAKYTDKYEVRKFIKRRIGEKYLIPLFGVYKKVDDIEFNSLPQSFIMKATHGCGWNIIVKDKSKIDWNDATEKMRNWVNSNYYQLTGQRNYKPLKGRVIIEKLLQDPSGDLKDYKFHCFHGNPLYVVVHGGRYTDRRSDVYDMNWHKLPFKFAKKKNFSRSVEKPKRFHEMVAIARKLAKDFAYVRVDLYYTNDRIYFGELTFVPTNGYTRAPLEYGKLFGSLLDLNKYV